MPFISAIFSTFNNNNNNNNNINNNPQNINNDTLDFSQMYVSMATNDNQSSSSSSNSSFSGSSNDTTKFNKYIDKEIISDYVTVHNDNEGDENNSRSQ